MSTEHIVTAPLVDLTEDAAQNVVEDAQEGKPLMSAFENELSRLMGGASDLEAVADATDYSMSGALPLPEASSCSLPERASTPPIELPASTPEASSRGRPSNAFARLVAGFPARNQQLFTSLRSSILTLAQTSASAAQAAASLSRDLPATEVQNGIQTIRGLLDSAAREAAAAATQAAEATRSIDTSDLQSIFGSVSKTVKEVGEAYQHVGQLVGGEVRKVVREAVEGGVLVGERVLREESERERKELQEAIREFLGDVAEPHAKQVGKDKGKGKATEELPIRATPPRPFVEEVVDEEAPGIARTVFPVCTMGEELDEEETNIPPPVPPKVDLRAGDIPHAQSPSPAHTSTPPPVPKKPDPGHWTIHAPEHDDEGDSSDSSDDDAEAVGAPVNFSPRVSHPSRIHGFPSHPNSIPPSPYRSSHYFHQPLHPYITPCEALNDRVHERVDMIRELQRARDMQNRAAEAMRMFPTEDGFPMNASIPENLHYSPNFQAQPPPPHPCMSPHTSMPGMSSFPSIRASPPRMLPMQQQSPSPAPWGQTPFGPQRFTGDNHFCPLFGHPHGAVPPFMTSPPPPPPPPPPFAPQPPHYDYPMHYPAPAPPPASWMGDMGMYSRFIPFGNQVPSPAQQAYNAALKRALANIPMPSLQDQINNPQLSRRLWVELERVASEVPVPMGAVGWGGMPFEDTVRIRLEAGEEAILRARRVGEEGIDHRDIRLEEEDEGRRRMNMPMENPFATPPRTESPAHMAHHSRPGSRQGTHLPNFSSSRPVSAARMFTNFRPSPVPITPASPAPLRSPFERGESPVLPRGYAGRESVESSRSRNVRNLMYGQATTSPMAVPSDYGSARRSTPAVPVGAFSQSSVPAVPIDRRHMPSAPAVPGDDADAFEMLSPLLPHLPSHRLPMHSSHSNPLLQNLHRGTPPVPEVPEDDNANDECSRQPSSPFVNLGHHNYPLPFPSPMTSPERPQTPGHLKSWAPLSFSSMMRDIPRATTFPSAFPPPQPPKPPQSQMPGSFPSHHGGFGRVYGGVNHNIEGSRNPLNPFFQGEGMGLGGMQGNRHPHASNGYVPPEAFWPGTVDDDDEDEDEDDHRGRAMGRQYSMFTDDDDGFSFRSEEDRRGRSPTARGPRAQPGNYTPPGPPRFRIDQHLRELAGEKAGTMEHEVEGQQTDGAGDEEVEDDDQTVQEEEEQEEEGKAGQEQSLVEVREQPQRREQHEPSAPNTPTQDTYRLRREFDSQLEFLEQLERGVESFTLPRALPPPPFTHSSSARPMAAAVGTKGNEKERSPAFQPHRHPRNSPLPPPPAPFSYPPSPSPAPSPRLESQRFNPNALFTSRPNDTSSAPAYHPPSPPDQFNLPTPRLDLRGFNPDALFTPRPNDTDTAPGPSSQPPPQFDQSNPFYTPANENINTGIHYEDNNEAEDNSAALALLPRRRRSSSLETRIDECMAQLVEMGYADQDDSENGFNKLRVYARHADGDVHTALELLEEDSGAWEERHREEAEASERGDGQGSQSEGWRLAGWY